MKEIVVEFWGDYACFSAPYAKVERLSYPAPTPTAVVGMLQAIYNKPAEFYWQVRKIEILEPIRYIALRFNEVKVKMNANCSSPVDVEAERTQRQTMALKDVRYRITAEIVPRAGFAGTVEQLYAQAIRRIENGKCFFQPWMGCRDFLAYFEMSDGSRQPVPVDIDMGLVAHDLWSLDEYKPTLRCKTNRRLFHCKIEKGVINVPPRCDCGEGLIT